MTTRDRDVDLDHTPHADMSSAGYKNSRTTQSKRWDTERGIKQAGNHATAQHGHGCRCFPCILLPARVPHIPDLHAHPYSPPQNERQRNSLSLGREKPPEQNRPRKNAPPPEPTHPQSGYLLPVNCYHQIRLSTRPRA
jgi:hypothetical protein